MSRASETGPGSHSGSLSDGAWPICAALTELSHIGVGRTLTATDVLLLEHNRLVRVIHATTGELLRELTIDPARDHQPTGRPPGPAPKTQ
jgi:hypothetical protein